MVSTELRIGNRINYITIAGETECVVDIGLLDELEPNNNSGSHGLYHAIPLTEERLVKFGFLKRELELTNLVTYTMGSIEFMFDTGIVSVFIGLQRIDDGSKINTVHQCQNLYFAVHNEELAVI